MALAAGLRLGPYEILNGIGAGGMGEVYRAKDTRLDRLVAIKVLPSHLTADPETRRRFDREARVISALNHPHICALYDIGHQDGHDFIVMELVEGESLVDRLKKGPLSIGQALQSGIQIGDALARAHRQGIVHRDLKPANVMLTKTGAKLLDFGLAKIAGAQPASPVGPTNAETLTQAGTVLGTFQYMAPEQLEGQEADARTDIFAFGALIYEMVTGMKAFAGKTQASVIAAILEREPPPISAAQPLTPPALEWVVRTALAKDPDARWQNAHDIVNQLRWIGEGGSQIGIQAPMVTRRHRREAIAWSLLAMALLVVVALARPYLHSSAPPSVVRFTIAPPEGAAFAPLAAPIAPFPAISPDGKLVAFLATLENNQPSIWIRNLESLDTRSVKGTAISGTPDPDAPMMPFWSPDSRSIGFFAEGKLKRVDLDGGSARIICDAPVNSGAAWGAEGTIVFGRRTDEGIYKVSANGGTPTQITKVDRDKGEISHANPTFLPDGRHFFFWVRSTGPSSSIWVGSIDSTTPKHVLPADSRAVYAPPGHVLFVRQGALYAQPFDPDRLETAGEPSVLADDVRTNNGNGRSAFTASANGILVYRTGEVRPGLAWQDRDGRELGTVPQSEDRYEQRTMTPDDHRVIAHIHELPHGGNLWALDLAQGTKSRLTSGPYHDEFPVVSPDGTAVVYSSSRGQHAETARAFGTQGGDLYRKNADGTGEDTAILKSAIPKRPYDWSEHWFVFGVFSIGDRPGKRDLWVLPTTGESTPKPYLQTAFNQVDGRVSPDERWMAYTSDESGIEAVYIRPFPDANAGKWRVSGPLGGSSPHWRADGKELFYITLDGHVMAAPLRLGERSVELGPPQQLFQIDTSVAGENYFVTRDGKRFLVDRKSGTEAPLTVVLNWPSLLARK
jgi:Tol biopolymer transport system component